MSEPSSNQKLYVCPDCKCQFMQPFKCTTCGAQKLYDSTIQTQADRIERLETMLLSIRKGGLIPRHYRNTIVALEKLIGPDDGERNFGDAVEPLRASNEPRALPSDCLNDWDLENVRKEMESRGWKPDSKGDPDCVDQASAMAEAAIRELQARRANPSPSAEPVAWRFIDDETGVHLWNGRQPPPHNRNLDWEPLYEAPAPTQSPVRCACGAHVWPDDCVQIEDSRNRLHTQRGCQPS